LPELRACLNHEDKEALMQKLVIGAVCLVLAGSAALVLLKSPQERQPVLDAVSLAANLFALFAAALAIYIYLANKGKISKAIQLLLNFSFQTTLSELKEKLERLNEYSASEPTEIEEIKNILHEIAGQIRGNNHLNEKISSLADSAENLANNKKKLSEPAKRSFISELREQLKNIQIDNVYQAQE